MAAWAGHLAEATPPTAQPEGNLCNTSSASPSSVSARWPRLRARSAAVARAPVLMGARARSSRRRTSLTEGFPKHCRHCESPQAVTDSLGLATRFRLVSIDVHENNGDVVDRAAIQRNFQQTIARLG